jgi:4-hydroxybenzoate polyprenyltransferase
MSEFGELAIGSVLVIPLVIGIVQFAKKFGLEGNGNIVLALVLGFLFGGLAYGIDQSLLPELWIPYIKWVVFSLSVAISAGGLYDVGKTRFGTNDV